MARTRGGAKESGPGILGRLVAWAGHHGHSLLSTLGRLSRAPFATSMTLGVIGIALALPASLHLFVDNVRAVSGNWDSAMHLSVFMKPDTAVADAQSLAGRLRARPDVHETRVIPPDQALAEFRAQSGFGDALDALRENPLPTVLVVVPGGSLTSPGQLQPLIDEIERAPAVDFVQLDTQWLQRLFALVAIAQRTILVVALLLGIAVAVTVGNTIRLDIQNRRQEIEVTKLIGGSDAFIRRPFLYTGFWYGVGGGLVAAVLLGIARLALEGPVARLAGLYGSNFTLSGLGAGGFVGLVAVGALLAWAGSWIAVGQHLDEIEPT
ncbi:MAG: permease-like cell division protein FtsX [Gammaproteobacteria bacterium]